MRNDGAHFRQTALSDITVDGAGAAAFSRKGRLWQRVVFLIALLLFACALKLCAQADSSAPLIKPLPIEDAGGEAMHHFYDSLKDTLRQQSEQRLEQGSDTAPAITRIVHFGDSHVAADLLTGVLRRLFQRDFGNAGTGFIYAGRPWKWYAPRNAVISVSSGWHTDGLSLTQLASDGSFGLSGISFTARNADDFFSLRTADTCFDLYLLRQPDGGAIDVLLNGEIIHRAVSLNAHKREAMYLSIEAESSVSEIEETVHHLEIRIVKSGLVRVLGVTTEKHHAGVVYDAPGINGARVTRLLEWDEALLADNLAYRHPDLVIVAYGSNEAGDANFDANQYRRTFAAALKRIRRAVPAASLLVIAPPDRGARAGGQWESLMTLPGLVSAQRQAARENNAAFWDLYHAMGGAGAIERWAMRSPGLAQSDRVHLTAAGYRIVAEALYSELMRGFRENRRPLKTETENPK